MLSLCLLIYYVLYSETVPKWVHHAVIPVVKSLEDYVPQPYAGEIRGLGSVLGGSLSDAIILNFAYEFSAYVQFQIHVLIINWKKLLNTHSVLHLCH